MTLLQRIRMLLRWIVLLVMTCAQPVQAAELFYMDHDPLTGGYVGAVGPLVISGDIVPGDYARLLRRIADDEERFLSLNRIILASEEGEAAEAMKIAALVKALHSEVSVGPLTGRCVGACFLIYVAANQRATDGERLIGIHRLASVDAFLLDNALPVSLLDEQSRHAATDIYWLSDLDEKSLGYRSPAFILYLKTRCAWDEGIERDVYSGVRPFSDLKPLLECRARVTRADARAALRAAFGRALR